MVWDLQSLTLSDEVTHIYMNLSKSPGANLSFGENLSSLTL